MVKASHCKTSDCTSAARVRGLCDPCYQRWYTSGTFQPLLQTVERHRLTEVDTGTSVAVCSICGPTRIRVRSGRRGHECWTVRLRHRPQGWRGERKPESPQARRAARIKALYGMSEADWTERLIDQSGRCAICSHPMLDPYIDHDHSTGRVRGLLCRPCNLGIGFLRDDPDNLRAAIDYLR